MNLLAGYAQSTITPDLSKPVFLAGFGQNRKAQSIHDDLFIRALALRSGSPHEKIILVLAAVDLIGLFRKDILIIQGNVKAVYPDVEIILASTHTHHGPDTLGLWGPDHQTSGIDPDYIQILIETITRTILKSIDSFHPTDMVASSIIVPGVAKNARNPQILDQELSCLQFKSDPGILASLLIFPCHPEVLWEHNPHITSDYPFYLRAEVEKVTQAPCLFFAGALGGMMTPNVIDHSFQDAEKMGNILAKAALNALHKPKLSYPNSQGIFLELNKIVFNAPITNPIYHLAIQAGLLPHILDENNEITTEANLLKIGGVWIATVPGELLPKLGLKIKDDLIKAGADLPIILGLANDELGYILPEEDFIFPENLFQPGDHYEETNSIGPNIGSILLEKVHQLMHSPQ
jgi:hypothetical protein